jgi:hypothetical protein
MAERLNWVIAVTGRGFEILVVELLQRMRCWATLAMLQTPPLSSQDSVILECCTFRQEGHATWTFPCHRELEANLLMPLRREAIRLGRVLS